jgi:anti-sigma regulatory factor (Ser/Thr protein kinase)
MVVPQQSETTARAASTQLPRHSVSGPIGPVQGNHYLVPPTEIIALRVDPAPSAPAEIRRAIYELRDTFAGDTAERLALLLTELVTNSLRYAHFKPRDSISVRVERRVEGLFGWVCDPGGLSIPKLEEKRLDNVGGRGLVLVDAIARRWGVRTGDRTCVWFEFDDVE